MAREHTWPPLAAPPADADPAAEAMADNPGRTAGSALAYVLGYPNEGFCQQLDEALERIGCELPEAAGHLEAFAAALRPLPTGQREELYTRTFDINPVCSLEIGWQLFGEEYHRGALLVRLRQELRQYGIEESTELPDHLSHVLSLLDRMSAQAAGDFAGSCVMPALDKMLAAFEGQENPYAQALLAVAMYVRQYVQASDSEPAGHEAQSENAFSRFECLPILAPTASEGDHANPMR